MHANNHAQMGREARYQAYSEVCPSIDRVLSCSEPAFLNVKMEDNEFTRRTGGPTPIGEFPRVGEDGYKFHRYHRKRSGGVTCNLDNQIQI